MQEAKSGQVNIADFEPESVDWLINYIYTGQCDISTFRPDRKTQFLTCIEAHNIADYFNMDAMAEIALDTLKQDLDGKIGPMQLTYEAPNYLDDLLEAIQVVYQHIPLGDTDTTSENGNGLRRAFLEYVFAARFFFLNNPTFSAAMDTLPAFSLDLFRAMRSSADFAAHQPDAHCLYCRNKPSKTKKGHYTHLAPEKLRLLTCCSNCASKKEFALPTKDWLEKNQPPDEREQLLPTLGLPTVRPSWTSGI